jgi:hypothetical protein
MSTLAIPLVCKTKYDNNLIVVYDGINGEASISKKSHDPKVAGVTTDLDNAELMLCDFGDNPHRLIAVGGRIGCYVQGPIGFGDCVVTSNIEGIGQKLDSAKYVPGCIIGKSLANITDNSTQLIEIVVTVS